MEAKQISRRSFAALLGVSGLGVSLTGRAVADVPTEAASVLASSDRLDGDGVSTVGTDHADRWTAALNEPWAWFERESNIDGEWVLSGITTPINSVTGERLTDVPGYLDESLVPPAIRFGSPLHASIAQTGDAVEFGQEASGDAHGKVSFERQARDGRPPSEWLLSMDTEELREWLSKVEVPEAGVHGMSFWTHLTRDHFFRPLLIKGLSEVEQAKLHAAAHHGY